MRFIQNKYKFNYISIDKDIKSNYLYIELYDKNSIKNTIPKFVQIH